MSNYNDNKKEELKRLLTNAVAEKVEKRSLHTPEDEMMDLIINTTIEEVKKISSSEVQEEDMMRNIKGEVFNYIYMESIHRADLAILTNQLI